MINVMAKNSALGLIDTLEELFSKAPALPKNAKDFIVGITPWVALVFGVLGVLIGLSGLGFMTALAPLASMGWGTAYGSGVGFYGLGMVSSVLFLGSSALMVAAYPGTKSRMMSGWTFLFWSQLLSVVSSFITMNLVNGLLAAIIGFYPLFQIKSYYK